LLFALSFGVRKLPSQPASDVTILDMTIGETVIPHAGTFRPALTHVPSADDRLPPQVQRRARFSFRRVRPQGLQRMGQNGSKPRRFPYLALCLWVNLRADTRATSCARARVVTATPCASAMATSVFSSLNRRETATDGSSQKRSQTLAVLSGRPGRFAFPATLSSVGTHQIFHLISIADIC
jgi:hypothetical protein